MGFPNQPLDSNSIPIANVYVDGNGFIATQGSVTTDTDGLGNTCTPVNVNIAQVNSALTVGYIGTDDIMGNGILKVISVYKNADNGYDEPRNNQDTITLINASSVTTTQTSAQQINYNSQHLIVVLDMTDASANPSVTLSIQGVEPVTGATWTILQGQPVTADSVNVYRVSPLLPPVIYQTAQALLPRTWQVVVTANNANSANYQVTAIVLN